MTAQAVSAEADEIITAGQYKFFLNEVACDDVFNFYEERSGQIVRVGKAGSYRYEVSDEQADAPVLFMSWDDAEFYCSSKNSAATSRFAVVCCNANAANVDRALKSNALTFCLADAEARIHQASGAGIAFFGGLSAEEWESFFVFEALVLGVTSNFLDETEGDFVPQENERNFEVQENPQRSFLKRFSSESDLQSSEKIDDQNSSLRKIKSMNDFQDLSEQRDFSFLKKSTSIEPIRSQKKMTTILPLSEDFLNPQIKNQKIETTQRDEQGKFEEKAVELSSASYDHFAAQQKINEQRHGQPEKKSSKTKVSFALPEPVAEPFVLCERADYDKSKRELSTHVQEIQKNNLDQSFSSLSPNEQQSLLKKLSELCDNAIEVLKMAARTVDPKQMIPMKKGPSAKTRKKVTPPEIKFSSTTVNWSDMTQEEKGEIFTLERANNAITNLRNFKNALLASDEEAGFTLLESQKEKANQNSNLDRTIWLVGQESQQPLDKRDREIGAITDLTEMKKEREKVDVVRKALNEIRDKAYSKTKESSSILKVLKGAFPLEDSIQAREEAMKESVTLISETLVLADELTNILERKKILTPH